MQFNRYYNLNEAIEFSGDEVYEDGKKIAELTVDEAENVTKEEVISYFEDEESNNKRDNVIEYIHSLKLPKVFTYVWIQYLRVLPTQRGQGRGSEIINTLAMHYPPGTLLALSAEEISSGKSGSSLKEVIQFYKQNGFTMVKDKYGKVFGFRVQ